MDDDDDAAGVHAVATARAAQHLHFHANQRADVCARWLLGETVARGRQTATVRTARTVYVACVSVRVCRIASGTLLFVDTLTRTHKRAHTNY